MSAQVRSTTRAAKHSVDTVPRQAQKPIFSHADEKTAEVRQRMFSCTACFGGGIIPSDVGSGKMPTRLDPEKIEETQRKGVKTDISCLDILKKIGWVLALILLVALLILATF